MKEGVPQQLARGGLQPAGGSRDDGYGEIEGDKELPQPRLHHTNHSYEGKDQDKSARKKKNGQDRLSHQMDLAIWDGD